MGNFFQDFYNKIIAPTSKAIGTSPLNPGKQALDINQRLANEQAARGHTGFFDSIKDTAKFTKAFTGFGVANSPVGSALRTAQRGINQVTGGDVQLPGAGFKTGSFSESLNAEHGGPILGALGIAGDILGGKELVHPAATVAKAGVKTAAAKAPATTVHAGFFDNFKPSEAVKKTEPQTNATVAPEAPKPAEAPPIAQANRATNEANTAKVVEDTLAGKREDVRLTQPKALRQAVDYPANKLPEGTTPDTTVTVYRAGTGPKPVAGDHVTLSEAQATKYATQREGAKVTSTEVPLKDLVQSEGLKSEFIYHPETPPVPKEPAVSKLITALGEAKPGLKQIEKQQSVELGKRTTAGQKALDQAALQGQTPEQGFAAAKKALQGPLLSEKPSTISTKLDQADLNELYKTVQDHPHLRFFEKIRAFDSLNKVMKGEIPQRNELALLEQVFGPEFSQAVLKNRSTPEKIRQLVLETANIPRAIKSSLDFSAPFRQGLVLTVKHPVKGLSAGKEMFKQAFSPKAHAQWLEDLKSSPEYGKMKDAGLYIADPKAISGGLNAKEEAFMTGLAEHIPILGRFVKGSERAYVGYLNKLRVDVFNDLSKKFESSGIDDEETLKSLAKFINVATGRGNLGRLEKVAPELNTVFFAPRNMAARIQMLNPVWYKKLPPPVRKEAIKSAFAVIGTGLTILSIAKLAGAEVESDPRSSDFGKIKIGNLRYDIWGGFQQYARFGAQLLTGQKKTAGGIQDTSRLDTGVNFVRSKLAPVPGTVVDIAEGKDYVGNPVTPASVATNLVSPFVAQDMVNGYKQAGVSGVLETTPSIFGVGAQNYTPKSTTTVRKSSGSGLKKTPSGGRVRKTRSVKKGRRVRVASSRVRKGRAPKAVRIKKIKSIRGKKL